MTKNDKPTTSAEETMLAARRFSRRTFLKTGAAVGSVAATGPWIVRDALSSSGELNILNWDDELPDPVIPDFEKTTGIKVNSTPFSQNEEQINKLQATEGEGFDLCQPTHDRAPQFKDIGVLQALRREEADARRRSCRRCSNAVARRLDLGRQALPRAALLGHRGDLLAQRPDQARYGDPVLRHAVGRRVQGQGAGPPALAPARHRPVDGRQRQAAVEPHARRLQGRGRR